jgi:hypothetical protein
VVVASDVDIAVHVDRAPGGYDVRVGAPVVRHRYQWALRRHPPRGAATARRLRADRARGVAIRLTHRGTQFDVQVLPAARSELCA